MSKEKLIILLAAAFIALIICLPSGHPPAAVSATNDKSVPEAAPGNSGTDAPVPVPARSKKSSPSSERASATGATIEEAEPPQPQRPAVIVKAPEPDPEETQITAVYAKRFCGQPPPDADHAAERAYDIDIPLTEGCFAGPYTVPAMWSKTKVQRSKADGDWASVWCLGHALPSPIHAHKESFTEADFANCGNLSFQGKGSVHFSALDLKQGTYMIHPMFGERPAPVVP